MQGPYTGWISPKAQSSEPGRTWLAVAEAMPSPPQQLTRAAVKTSHFAKWPRTPCCFCLMIISSTRLATRLRESGMTVYGIGRRNTPAPFVAACDRFIYLDLLSQEPQKPAQPASDDEEPTPPLPNLKQVLSTAISSTSKDDGWSNLGEVGSCPHRGRAAADTLPPRPFNALSRWVDR